MLDKDTSVKLYQSVLDKRQTRPMNSWHCSSLAACPRAVYFKRLGVPELEHNRPSAARLIRWDAGNHLETAIRPHIASVFTAVDHNVRLINDELGLRGEYDNFAFTDTTLIEIKSVDDWAFIERKDAKGNTITSLKDQVGVKKNAYGRFTKVYEPRLKPYTHHLIQNHGYVLLLATPGTRIEIKEAPDWIPPDYLLEKTDKWEYDQERERWIATIVESIPVDTIKIVYIALKGRVVAYSTPVSKTYLEAVKRRLGVLNGAWEDKETPDCACRQVDEKGEPDPLWGGVYQWCDYRTKLVDDQDTGPCCDPKLLQDHIDQKTNEVIEKGKI